MTNERFEMALRLQRDIMKYLGDAQKIGQNDDVGYLVFKAFTRARETENLLRQALNDKIWRESALMLEQDS